MWNDPFYEIRRFEQDINKMFEDFWNTSNTKKLPNKNIQHRRPRVEMEETKKDMIAVIELPGVKKENINIDLTDETIQISVEENKEKKSKKNYSVTNQAFFYQTRLPKKIKVDESKANYHAGVLEVIMPKQKNTYSKTKRLKID